MKIQLPPSVHHYPAPVVLIGCGTISNPGLITVSWFGTVCSRPPMISISIRPSRHSYDLIHKSGEFSVNIPFCDDLKIVKYCGSISGREVNKFTELNLTPRPCPPLNVAPMVEEFPMALACRVKHELSLGTHQMFVAEILSIHCNEDLVHSEHHPDSFPERQLVYLDGKYWGLHLESE